MHFRPVIHEFWSTGLAAEEHAGERRETKLLHSCPCVEREIDVDRRCRTRMQHELIGAGETRAIKERPKTNVSGVLGGTLKPKTPEDRELLAGGKRRIDGQ